MPEDIWSFYDEVNALAKEVAKRGHATLADKLNRAMYGSTSGEILGDIYLALREAVSDGGPQCADLTPMMRAMMQSIERMHAGL